MTKVGLGIISYAHPHASKYAAAISDHPDTTLVAIAGTRINSENAKEAADRYGIPYYDDYQDLFARDDISGVYVGTEPALHLEVVAVGSSLGKHILCDKPIALTLGEADEIIGLVKGSGIKFMVPFNPRYQLPLMKVKAALDKNEAGDLVSIFAIKYGKLPSNIPGSADYSWLMDPQQAGGGGFLDIGIHAIDALRWLAGSEATSIYAHMDRAIFENLSVDGLGLMTVEFENGVLGGISAGWVNPDSYPTWLDVRFEILTTKKAFMIDSPYHDYWLFGANQTERIYWWRKDVDGLVDEFIQAIQEDRQPAISGEDARSALAIALAAYESAASGKVITLEHS